MTFRVATARQPNRTLLYLYRATGCFTVVEAGMATKVTVTLEDDLDGGSADETVRFGVGGAEYEIDLNEKNVKAFCKQLRRLSRMPAGLAGGSAAVLSTWSRR
jgi:hypothetical protein